MERGKEAEEGKSEAGGGWFMRCQDRSRLRNITAPGGAATAEGEAAVSYPEGPAEIIPEGGYREQCIFNVDGAD